MTVAVYVRVSTQRQAQAQTIEQQLDRLRAHLRDQGVELASEHVFRDDGHGGATLNRPGLDRLRDAVRAGEVDQVLVTDPDRLARSYVQLMVLLEELERFGCEVTFLDRPMGREPQDQLLLQIRGAVAEYERTLIAERMRRGRQAKLRAGCLLPWTRPPYGFRLDPDHPRDPAGVTVEAAEAAVVREVFARYLEDRVGLLGLAKQLSAQGIPSPSGKRRWSSATLRGILTNPLYAGRIYAGRRRSRAPRIRRSATHPIGKPSDSRVPVPAAEWLPVASVPALVSEEQFARVQAKPGQNRAFARRHNTAHAYLLQARREQLRQGRHGPEGQLERLTEAYLLAVIPLPEYQRRRQALEQRLQALETQAGRLEAQVDRQAELAGWATSAADFCRRVRAGLAGADFARKRQLVELLIDRVLISDGEVEIRYVVPLSPGSETVHFCHLRKDYGSSRDPGCWDRGSRDERPDERGEEGLAPSARVVDDLEEGEIGGELLLRDAPVRPQPGAQQRPDALHRVDVDLAEAVTIVIARVLAPSVADGLVPVAPPLQAGVDVVLVGVHQRTGRDVRLDHRPDRRLLHVGQHAQDDLAAPLEQAQDRRLVLVERAPAGGTPQPPAAARPPFLATAAGWPLWPATT